MKIETVEALALNAPMENPIRIAGTQFTKVRALIVRVTTDSGLTGIGECVVRSAPRATGHLVEEMLAPRIVGGDPLDAAGLWWQMFSAMRQRGHSKGLFVEAMSGIDVALWDIIGQALELPTYRALHGHGRTSLPAYGSSVFQAEPGEMADSARRFVDLGYRAVKIKLGMGVKRDVRAMETIRTAVGGDVGLMVDVNSAYSAADAVTLGRALEPLDVEWLEEPVPPDDLAGYRRVRTGQPLPIAGGEGEFSLYGFRDLLDTGAVDIVQPDIGRVGGLTEGMRIAALIQSHNLAMCPHTGMFSALNVVAALHFAAAAPRFHLFEFMEVDHPLMDIFTEPIPRPADGTIGLPEGPGLGVTLDMDKIDRWIET